MKVFVCNLGQARSPTAAALWSELFDEEAYSVAVNKPRDRDENLLNLADNIIVMEQEQKQWITQNYPAIAMCKEIICLDIPAQYHHMQPELVELLREKFREL